MKVGAACPGMIREIPAQFFAFSNLTHQKTNQLWRLGKLLAKRLEGKYMIASNPMISKGISGIND